MGLIKKSQTWSIDVLVAVFIFVAIFIMFVGIMSSMSDSQRKRALSERGERITKILSSETSVSFLKGNRVDDEKLKDIVGDYDALKDEFDYDNFCIYFEDQEGNLVPIEGVDDEGNPIEYNGMGSGDAKVSGRECGVGQ